jgi:hypothetical protein
MTHTTMFHRAYMERAAQDAPPSVKIGMLIGCQPTGATLSGTELRAKFAAFLGCPASSPICSPSGFPRPRIFGHGST